MNRKVLLGILSLLVLSMVMSACFSRPKTGEVSGKITFEDGTPVAEADVRIGLESTKTSAGGEYAFNNIKYGKHTLSVHIDGRRVAEESIELSDTSLIVNIDDIAKITEPVGGGTIAWQSDRSGQWQIFTAKADGTEEKVLRAGLRPVLTLDGTQIVFESPETPRQLWVMNADGSNARQITHEPMAHYWAAWSPNGTQIAFEYDTQLWVMKADGSDRRQLTTEKGRQPSWSPDGKQIAYSSNRSGSYDLYIINADGTGDRRLTDTPRSARLPAWSPDGKSIIFDSDMLGANEYEVYRYNLATGEIANLTNSPGNDLFPAWSPDGSKIIFTSVRGANGKESLYMMDPDGSNVETVKYADDAKNEYGTWSW